MIPVLARALVFAGALILAGSLIPTRRLIARVPHGPVRNRWSVKLVLIVVFLCVYLGYVWVTWNSRTQLPDLLAPGVFFLGACFVWLTANLSLQTTVVVMRISVLEEENISDPLTGAFNRRYLDRRLCEEVTRARRYGQSLSVLLLDIDHFKKVNDRYGHQAGDQILTSFVELVGRHLREPDILSRYGGEEFMVIASQTDHEGAVELAERLRTILESNRFDLGGVQSGTVEVSLTCSIGVASVDEELDRAEKLVRSADENLYRAKHDGRNRVNAQQPSAAMP